MKDRSQSKLGMAFEKRIETTNQYYLFTKLAIIQKIPTPTKNIKGKIVYSEKSTVDFMGMYKETKFSLGIPVAFEAKETATETNFPLNKGSRGDTITRHQREFLKTWETAGGLAFVLIHFRTSGECYAVPIQHIDDYYIDMEKGGRKSIPMSDFRKEWKVDPDDYLGLIKK